MIMKEININPQETTLEKAKEEAWVHIPGKFIKEVIPIDGQRIEDIFFDFKGYEAYEWEFQITEGGGDNEAD